MDWFDIVTGIAAIFGLAALISIWYQAWPFIILVAGIFLVNTYTVYAMIIIQIFGTFIHLYDPVTKGRRAGVRIIDAIFDGLHVTFGVVATAWFVGLFLSG
ncbi:hypothetical protein [Shewanella youngdeokensis]|uniref:YutG/PgpA domain-containing protein n=1 Tax=Shewanella youngdeokensis TaxID=2999068 RepID=A0ABZ0K0W9_9GAMM|nr:hypothetical protein RGE70_00630 [Shewanella sp. DAU334]